MFPSMTEVSVRRSSSRPSGVLALSLRETPIWLSVLTSQATISKFSLKQLRMRIRKSLLPVLISGRTSSWLIQWSILRNLKRNFLNS